MQQQQQQQQHQQQQQRLQAGAGQDGTLMDGKGGATKSRMRDVWKSNLAQEMQVLRGLVEKYPYISMVSLWLQLQFSFYVTDSMR